MTDHKIILEELDQLFGTGRLEQIKENDIRLPKLARFREEYVYLWLAIYEYFDADKCDRVDNIKKQLFKLVDELYKS